jgi:excinuclease ABC subunit C
VANGYNELLLRRRISESQLDDIPGVSEAKKKALLKKFGSIVRLRKASLEEIAQISGISSSLALIIRESLLKS